MKLRPPSPALVISCIALVVACAGTAFAATIITSSTQVKNGVLTGSDIKNGSISAADIRKGSITSNRLSNGTRRLLSRSSASGGSGVAYHAVRKVGPENQPASVLVTGVTLNVPAGAYVVTASTIMSALPPPVGLLDGLVPQRASPTGRCVLDAAGDTTQAVQSVIDDRVQTPATFSMQLTRTVGGPSQFKLDCGADLPFTLTESSIIATPVSAINLSSQP